MNIGIHLSFSDEQLDEMARLARAATQEPWQWGHSGTETLEDAVQYATEQIEKTYLLTDRTDLWMAFHGDPNVEGGTKIIAFTGNGLTSEANAAYLMAAQPQNLIVLIDELRRARAKLRAMHNKA
jgi:hypothetical protein